MEDLPADLALIILSKLAAQDPLSMLRAMCASNLLFWVAEDNPVFWLKAFFALVPSQDMPELDGRCKEPSAKFEAEMFSLGFCRQLVVARLAKLEGSGCEQIRALGDRMVAHERKQLRRVSDRPAKVSQFVHLIRAQGKLLLWRSYTEEEDDVGDCVNRIFEILFCTGPPRYFPVVDTHFKSVYADVTFRQIHEAWAEVVGSAEQKGPHLLTAPVTIEIQRVVNEGEHLNKYCLLSPEIYEHEYEAFGSWGYLAFKDPQCSTISAITSTVKSALASPSRGELLVRNVRKALHWAKVWFFSVSFVLLVLLVILSVPAFVIGVFIFLLVSIA